VGRIGHIDHAEAMRTRFVREIEQPTSAGDRLHREALTAAREIDMADERHVERLGWILLRCVLREAGRGNAAQRNERRGGSETRDAHRKRLRDLRFVSGYIRVPRSRNLPGCEKTGESL
jgi:hypothetical protein